MILFLAGPSGCGKSTFAAEYLRGLGWVHLEIDRDGGNGIGEHELRKPWDRYYQGLDPAPLEAELTKRRGAAPGIVVTFPSRFVLTPPRLTAASGRFHVAYLFGLPQVCVRAFLAREAQTGRGLPASHWNENNSPVYDKLARPENKRYCVAAFAPDGSRRPPAEILADIQRVPVDA